MTAHFFFVLYVALFQYFFLCKHVIHYTSMDSLERLLTFANVLICCRKYGHNSKHYTNEVISNNVCMVWPNSQHIKLTDFFHSCTPSKYHTNSMLNGVLHVVPWMNYEKIRLNQVKPISFHVTYKYYLNLSTGGVTGMSGKLVMQS
jgi:hypothetical protein